MKHPSSAHDDEAELRLRYRLRRSVGPAFALVAFAAAIWFLSREMRHYDYRDIRHALAAISWGRTFLALLLTTFSFIVLVGYDYLAVRFLGYPLSIGKIALVSFIGHVSSFNFGAVLGGTTVRYRLYSAWGLSAVEIVKVITLSTATFWSGYLMLAGVIFLVDPVVLPDALHIPFRTVAPIGVMLLALVTGYLAMCAFRRRPLRFRGWEFPIPSLPLAISQMIVSATDLAASGGTLYVLLPADLPINYGHFLTIYLIATVAVLFTHVPGGLGILELVILLLLAPTNSAGLIGSLLAFRAIYYLLPLLVAAGLLAAHEVTLRRQALGRVAGAMGRWAPAVAPRFLSFLTLIAGSTMLFSGALPTSHTRVAWWHDYLPLAVIEFSHFMNSIAGVMLLLLAYSLERRLNTAFWASVAGLIAGIVFSLLKGFDPLEPCLLGVALAVLVPCRPFFYRRSRLIDERHTPEWTATVTAVLLAAGWLGLFAFRHVEFSNDLWARFSLHGDASRVLRGGIGVLTVLLLIGIAHWFRHPEPKPHRPTSSELDIVQKIAAASPRTYAHLALAGDKHLLFNDARTAMVMYAAAGRSWVSMGDPVGPAREQPELVWSFRELAEHYGGWPVFYQVSTDLLPVYLDLGLTLLKLGEEARVPLADFGLDAPARLSLLQSLARAGMQGCRFELVEPERVAALMPALARISAAHLAAHGTTERRFAYGPFDIHYLRQFPLALVWRDNEIVAFANVWLGAEHAELSVDMLRYLPEATESAGDLLLVELMIWGRQQGYRWFNLGMAPFAEHTQHEFSAEWRRLGELVNHYGEHFYAQHGVREYQEKFAPLWTVKYLAAPGGLVLPRILADLAELISGQEPRKPARRSLALLRD